MTMATSRCDQEARPRSLVLCFDGTSNEFTDHVSPRTTLSTTMHSCYCFSHRCAEHKCSQALQASRKEFFPAALLLPGISDQLCWSYPLDQLTIDALAGCRDRDVCPNWTILSDNAEARKLAGPSLRHVRFTARQHSFIDTSTYVMPDFLMPTYAAVTHSLCRITGRGIQSACSIGLPF